MSHSVKYSYFHLGIVSWNTVKKNVTFEQHASCYRSGTVNSKSFVSKDFLQNKWKYELTVHFKHEMMGKHFTETSNKVELRINHVLITRALPVVLKVFIES